MSRGGTRPLCVAAAVCLAAIPARAGDAGLAVDLSHDTVSITTGFTGARIQLFGAVSRPPGGPPFAGSPTGGADGIIVVARGPARREAVWRRGRIGGVWVNRAAVVFPRAPVFHHIAATPGALERLSPEAAAILGFERPLAEGASRWPGAPSALMEGARWHDRRTPSAGDAAPFAAALARDRQRAGLYGTEVGTVAWRGGGLFRAALDFPATTPTGPYVVETVLLRGGEVEERWANTLLVRRTGLDARLYETARHHPMLYGVAAVAMALLAGLAADRLFRRR